MHPDHDSQSLHDLSINTPYYDKVSTKLKRKYQRFCIKERKNRKRSEVKRGSKTGTDKAVNQVETESLQKINKLEFVYFATFSFKPTIDTGAVGNYITRPLATDLRLTWEKMSRELIRYTCLREAFKIQEVVTLVFKYEVRSYIEKPLYSQSEKTVHYY